MKISLTALCALAALIAGPTLAHAEQRCAPEKTAYDRALIDYNRAESQYTRLQYEVDAKAEQGAYRRAILEGNVEQARGYLNAANQIGLGQTFGCFFFPRYSCVGSAIYRGTQQSARARAQVRAQEGRLNAFNRAYQQQMSRLSQRVMEQEEIARQKKATLDSKEYAYQGCMAA